MKHDNQWQAENPRQMSQRDEVREEEYALPLFRREEQVKQPAAVKAKAHLGEVTEAIQRIDLQTGENSIGSGGQCAEKIGQRSDQQHEQRRADQPAAF